VSGKYQQFISRRHPPLSLGRGVRGEGSTTGA
jgi:hypothetical protein